MDYVIRKVEEKNPSQLMSCVSCDDMFLASKQHILIKFDREGPLLKDY